MSEKAEIDTTTASVMPVSKTTLSLNNTDW